MAAREQIPQLDGGIPIALRPDVMTHAKPRIVGRDDFLTREPPEVHALACFVHGALTALHGLGAVYNYRRRNWRDVAAHIAAAVYDAHSACHHYRTEQIALRRRAGTADHLSTPSFKVSGEDQQSVSAA